MYWKLIIDEPADEFQKATAAAVSSPSTDPVIAPVSVARRTKRAKKKTT